MIILGIDPGLATLGYGVVEARKGETRLIDYGTINTTAGQPMPHRLHAIYTGVDTLMRVHQPDEVAFEELFFSKNITTGMAVSAARGAALVAAVQHTNELFEYTPMQIKQSVTGYGGADKHQVQHMVRLLLHLSEIPRPDDAADAVAAALTHAACQHAKEMYRIK